MSKAAISEASIESGLDEALSTVAIWNRHPDHTVQPEACWETTSRVGVEERCLTVLLRDDGDIQVEFHVPSKRGTPFEVLFVFEPSQTAATVEEVRRFVAELVTEQLVLAYDRSRLAGGRRFAKPFDLIGDRGRDIEWVVSWHGTFDRYQKPVSGLASATE